MTNNTALIITAIIVQLVLATALFLILTMLWLFGTAELVG